MFLVLIKFIKVNVRNNLVVCIGIYHLLVYLIAWCAEEFLFYSIFIGLAFGW